LMTKTTTTTTNKVATMNIPTNESTAPHRNQGCARWSGRSLLCIFNFLIRIFSYPIFSRKLIHGGGGGSNLPATWSVQQGHTILVSVMRRQLSAIKIWVRKAGLKFLVG
jgi:hypothetical protein